MGSTARPTHYDTLRLAPGASAEDIDRAFAREIMRPRAFGGLAQVGIAHATLKDPAKRRAYDESIGLVRQAPRFLATSYSGWMTASAQLLPTRLRFDEPVTTSPPTPASETPAPLPERPTFIAASLRELAAPEPLVQRAHEPRHDPRPAPMAEAAPIDHQILDGDVPASSIDWRRPAVIGGGLTLAAVLFGAWAGSAVRDPVAPEADNAVTLAVPAARVRANAAQPASSQPEVRVAEAAARQRSSMPRYSQVRFADRAAPARPRPVPLSAAEEQELAGGAFVESATGQAAVAAESMAQDAAPVATSAAASAKMPLPARTVARTIGRIGYACGSVASITPVDSGSGVYKVTCASGDAYQARPVRGRYHFRRWGRN